VNPLPQICRMCNADTHQTTEDVTYHLQHTILTGDVENQSWVRISIRVLNGSISMYPLLEQWRSEGRADAVSEAIVERETGLRFWPYSELMRETILSGTYKAVDTFLRYLLYIKPDLDFAGYVQVFFEMNTGIYINYGADQCGTSAVVKVVASFTDPASIIISEAFKENGLVCEEGVESCPMLGLSVYDPDCEQVVDGSCYLSLNVTVTHGMEASFYPVSREVWLRRCLLWSATTKA